MRNKIILTVLFLTLLSGCAGKERIPAGGINHDVLSDITVTTSSRFENDEIVAEIYIINPNDVKLKVYQVGGKTAVKRKPRKVSRKPRRTPPKKVAPPKRVTRPVRSHDQIMERQPYNPEIRFRDHDYDLYHR